MKMNEVYLTIAEKLLIHKKAREVAEKLAEYGLNVIAETTKTRESKPEERNMYCAVFQLADDTIERDFLDELPTEKEIRSMENDYSIYVKVDNRAYYDNTERRPAKIVNLFKIGED